MTDRGARSDRPDATVTSSARTMCSFRYTPSRTASAASSSRRSGWTTTSRRTGVCGQVFHANPDEFAAQCEKAGQKVRRWIPKGACCDRRAS